MEIKRLKSENYDELLNLLNTVFSLHNNKEMDFEKELPRMCVRNDEYMSKHIGIYEDGKLCSAIGIYPLPVNICGEKLLFSTVGNVATLPEYEGRGYMSILMDEAMKELERIGADGSRLGGKRARYGRYGYEMCGTKYTFTMSYHAVSNFFREYSPGITFTEIKKDNLEALSYATDLYRRELFYVERSSENNFRDMYCSMTAWKNIPYIAKDKAGNNIGVMSITPAGNEISEIYSETPSLLQDMVVSYIKEKGQSITVPLRPHETEKLKMLTSVCENATITSPCRFKIINYKKVISALLLLKSKMCQLSDADFTLEIKNYGKLRIRCENGIALCEDYCGSCDISLDANCASRFLFGPMPASFTTDMPSKCGNLLPLPLSWNLQDRV